jgi:hypothetical protein
MAEKDMIVKGISIKYNSPFNMIDLYNSLKSWFDINRYTFYETSYDEKATGDKKSLTIRWVGTKELDDYTQVELKAEIELNDYEIIKAESEKLTKGKLKLKFTSLMVTDYEEKWDKNPLSKFFKAISDKYFEANKFSIYKKEIKNDTYDIYNKTKSFLNLQKFR